MSELLNKIKSRGYWKVIIRPATFVEKRVRYRSDLLTIIEKNSVEYRGRCFPLMRGYGMLDEGPNWVGQEIRLDPIVKLWRFYQSGQLVYYSAMPEDWNSELSIGPQDNRVSYRNSHKALEISDVVVRFAEIFELAARLSLTEAGDHGIHIEIVVDNLKDHIIRPRAHDNTNATWVKEAQRLPMRYANDFRQGELLAQPRELSLEPAGELLDCFGWRLDTDILRDILEQSLRQGPPVARWG